MTTMTTNKKQTMTTNKEQTMTTEPLTASLYFDLTKKNHPTDGLKNPAWRNAAQPFSIGSGDLGPIGLTWVAVLSVNGETGEYFGRDLEGRAVVLVTDPD